VPDQALEPVGELALRELVGPALEASDRNHATRA
jgi:hypothetical protein